MDDLIKAFNALQRQYDALHFDIQRLRDINERQGHNTFLSRIAKQESKLSKIKTALTNVALLMEDYD